MADPREAELAARIAASPHNLVGRRDRELLLDTHIPECRAFGPHLDPQPDQRWLDLGTGGGLPGLVLAIAYPATVWVLVDATAKKVAFVDDLARELGLENVEVRAGRAETLAHTPVWRGAFAGVVARAVAPMPTLLELARGFLSPGAMLGAVKGSAWESEVARAAGAARTLHLQYLDAQRVTEAARPTWMVRYAAVGAPPAGFPRREGLPKSAPLS